MAKEVWVAAGLAVVAAAGVASFLVLGQRPPSVVEAPREGVFRRATYQLPASLDPAKALSDAEYAVTNQIYEGLLSVDENLMIYPGLASSWTIDRATLTYRFELRPDAKFSDGTPLDASDVVHSLQRSMERQTQAKGSWGRVKRIYSDDKGHVSLQLRMPFPAIEAVLASPAGHIARLAKDGSWLGTGPYRLSRIDRETSPRKVVLERSSQTWRPSPYFSRIEYLELDEPSALREAYSGTIHDTSLHQYSDVDNLRSKAAFIVPTRARASSTWVVAMNASKPPLDNPGLRRCISRNLPRSAVTQHYPWHTLAGGLVPPGIDGHVPDLSARAEPDLCAAFADQGLQLLFPDSLAHAEDICDEIRAHFETLHINIECVGKEFGALLDDMIAGRSQLAFLGVALEYPSPEYYYLTFEPNAGWKISNTSPPQILRLLYSARQVASLQERKEAYEGITRYLFENDLTVNLSYTGHQSVRHVCLENFNMSLQGPGYVDLSKVRLTKDCAYRAHFAVTP